jgi:hypothetical protein
MILLLLSLKDAKEYILIKDEFYKSTL